ncbi:MAG: hypothetical protein M3541_12220 [Acidobacteriota bacterium]|nr:hypothetical protein [Acidobacteriota bacterium]MDQ3419525.1 hypothetical protein [Acidobacteriota bacterium]
MQTVLPYGGPGVNRGVIMGHPGGSGMAKSAVGVVARIVAKSESVDIVRDGLTSLLAPTRAESGCEKLDGHLAGRDVRRYSFIDR